MSASKTHEVIPHTFKSLTGKTAREWIHLAVNIPPRVEELVAEIKKSSPDYDDAKVWATAWSIYCKHIDSGSDHCHKPASEYLKKKASPDNLPEEKSDMGTKTTDDQLRADTIRLAHTKPELRGFLLPLVKEADAEEKTALFGKKKKPKKRRSKNMATGQPSWMGDEEEEAMGSEEDEKEAGFGAIKKQRGQRRPQQGKDKQRSKERYKKDKKDPTKIKRKEKYQQHYNKKKRASDDNFRKAVIRLASEKPALRSHLLPILKEAGRYPDQIELEDLETLTGPLTLTEEGEENFYFTDGDRNSWFWKGNGGREEQIFRRYMSY